MILTDGIDNETQVFCCTKCHLYWFNVDDKFIEVRLAVFSPIVSKDCPFCEGTNESPPTERFTDMQKVKKGELSYDDYFAKYPNLEET